MVMLITWFIFFILGELPNVTGVDINYTILIGRRCLKPYSPNEDTKRQTPWVTITTISALVRDD